MEANKINILQNYVAAEAVYAKRVCLIGTHNMSFRIGEPAEIKKICIAKLNDLEYVIVYEIEYADGFIDYCPVSEIGYSYKMAEFTGY